MQVMLQDSDEAVQCQSLFQLSLVVVLIAGSFKPFVLVLQVIAL